jgi:hypothetical protein
MLGSGSPPDPFFEKGLSTETKSFIITIPLPNEKGSVTMLNQDYTTKLLNLEDVIITNVENIGSEVHIHLELPRKAHNCPCCGASTSVVHDYRTQTIKERAAGSKNVPTPAQTPLPLPGLRQAVLRGKHLPSPLLQGDE